MPPADGETSGRKLRELEALYQYGRRHSALRVIVATFGTFLSAALLWSTVLDWRSPPSPYNLLGLVALDPYESAEAATAWWVAAMLLILLFVAVVTAASGAWGMGAVTAVAGLAGLAAEIVLWVQISHNDDVVGPGVIAAVCITLALVVWSAVSAVAIRDLGPEWAVAYKVDEEL